MSENTVETNDYDAVPYESHPFDQTTAQNLYTIAKLFSLDAPDYRNCKVLELGCASGGNIIPLAELYPDAEFTGIDLSSVQIDEGQKIIDDVGLKNIRLLNTSILDIDADFGTFDYIIAHGIYSWVPDEVQLKMLDICKQNLSETGVAYISYNTLPGWNMVKSIRDMMKYHIRAVDDVTLQVPQARSVVQFVHEAIESEDSPYAKSLKGELDLLLSASDYYIAHDHLEAVNSPCYFYEFMDRCRERGLNYLADTELFSMYLSNFPEAVQEKLKEAKDIVTIEQYLDFIRNRRFRSTLLCHESQIAKIDRALKVENIKDFYYSVTLTKADNLNPESFDSDEPVSLEISGKINLQVKGKLHKVIMYVFLSRVGKPIAFQELCTEVQKHFPDETVESLESSILHSFNLLELLFKGVIRIHSDDLFGIAHISEKPKVTEVARYLAGLGKTSYPNPRHQIVNANDAERFLVQYLDGKNTVDDLVEKMKVHVVNGELNIARDEQALTEDSEITDGLNAFVQTSLNNMGSRGMLIG